MYFYKSKETAKFYYNNLINQDEYNHIPTNDNYLKYDSILPYYSIKDIQVGEYLGRVNCVLGETINGYPIFIHIGNICKAFIDNNENMVVVGDITLTMKRRIFKELKKYVANAKFVGEK